MASVTSREIPLAKLRASVDTENALLLDTMWVKCCRPLRTWVDQHCPDLSKRGITRLRFGHNREV